MSEKRVSVCIPTYNNEKYILETMDSIINQTYDNIELVVVDDNSKDKTWEIVSEYKENFDRVKKPDTHKTISIYRNESNLGMGGNWSKAVSMCSGEYIRLICADDLLDESLINKEVEILDNNPEVVCVSSDTCFVDDSGTRKGSYRRYRKTGITDGIEAVKFSVFTRDYLGAPLANLFRKSAYEAAGGIDTSYKYITDYDLFMRIYLLGKVYIIHEPLNFFRIRKDSNTGQVMGGGREQEYIAEHRKLVESAAARIGLAHWQVELSVFIRRVMSFLGELYLKIKV